MRQTIKKLRDGLRAVEAALDNGGDVTVWNDWSPSWGRDGGWVTAAVQGGELVVENSGSACVTPGREVMSGHEATDALLSWRRGFLQRLGKIKLNRRPAAARSEIEL